MKKILCIIGAMDTGGAETFLMKIFREIDKTKFQMDFCVGKVEKGFYDDEILANGGKIWHITLRSKNFIKCFFGVKKCVKKGQYENVIKISSRSYTAIDLCAAKLGGARNLIFRSSNSNSCGSAVSQFLHILFKPLAILVPTVKVAPSEMAAIHLFGKKQVQKRKVMFLKNGLPIGKYQFNQYVRNKKRRELGIAEDTLVIGHVGRMDPQKNHKFLLDIFSAILKKNENAKLILIGDGTLKNDILQDIEKRNITNKVLILGVRSDANELYQAMDCFIFPSLFEGMPNAVIEAQTSGLYCLVSDTITKEVNITNRVTFCSLNSIDEWVLNVRKSTDRENIYEMVKEKGYDIHDVVTSFTNLLK